MKMLLIVGLCSFAAVSTSAQAKEESNCYQVFGELRCDVQLEPKPPTGVSPPVATAECRDAKGKLTACPAPAPKR
jgi:hypothetical protein